MIHNQILKLDGGSSIIISLYTRCFILSDMTDYFANRWFYWKIFRTKVAWLEGRHIMEIWTWPCQNQVKVINVFLNGNPYFLLHILVVYLESFSKYYISLSTFRVWSSKITVPPALSMYVCACERDSYARARFRDLSILLNIRSRA